MAKKKLNHGAADFMNDSDMLPDLPGGGMDMFANYEKFDVSSKKLGLKSDAQKLVKNLVDLYLSTDKIQRPEYVEAISKVENMNLAMLLGQVKYAEHALDSLMRQLDNGGFTDPATYEMIMRMQSNSIDITMRVSQYVRSLPEYFKHLEQDITKYQSIDLIQTGSEKLTDESGKSHDAAEFSANNTYRGTGDLMKAIKEARILADQQKENVQQILNEKDDVQDAAVIDDEEDDFDPTEDDDEVIEEI